MKFAGSLSDSINISRYFRNALMRHVRITLDHLHTGPPAQILQIIEARSVLHVPTGPRMTQIMPTKILDGSPIQCVTPALVITS